MLCNVKITVSVVLGLVVALGADLTNAAPPVKRELITLILVDAMRPDHVGAYGYKLDTTPNIDALAKTGTIYERAYANAPWTRPSTASFLTGLNASVHGAESAKTKLPTQIRTLASRLKAAGYTTAGFVANGNGGSLAALERDFDVFRDPTNAYTRKKRGKTYNGLPTGPFIVERALRWLRSSKADKIFMFLFLVDPHDPYRAPKALEQRFLGPNFKGKVRRNALWEYNNDYPEAERQSMLAVYDAGIAYSDQALGTFFAGLRKQELYDDSSIFISADHGEGFGEHGFYLHAHHFWDEVVRIPLVVKSPRIAGGRDGRLTQSIDVARTIAAIAGADESDLPGQSLLAPAPTAPRVISEYNEFGIHRQAIIGPRYKVVWQRPVDEKWFDRAVKHRKYFPTAAFGKEVVRVFDMTADPDERHDLGANPPAEAKILLKELREFVQ